MPFQFKSSLVVQHVALKNDKNSPGHTSIIKFYNYLVDTNKDFYFFYKEGYVFPKKINLLQ
jgi:hypothetical protein